MRAEEQEPLPQVASEAILVLDIVDSTWTSNTFGWHAVGRRVMRDLRAIISRVASLRGMQCRKSTGDGYLLTFGDSSSAETAAIYALESAFAILAELETRNRAVPKEHAIHLRFAVHFGEVDIVEGDREGPNVSYTFRMEGVSRSSIEQALNHADPESLPSHDYVLCSEEVAGILGRRTHLWDFFSLGLFKFKGFTGHREVCRVLPRGAGLYE